jgi:hypothetical protein
MAVDPPLERGCRECGKRSFVAAAATRCPACGAPFGRLTFGLDVDPAEAARMDRDRQRVTDDAYRSALADERKEQMRRAVTGEP